MTDTAPPSPSGPAAADGPRLSRRALLVGGGLAAAAAGGAVSAPSALGLAASGGAAPARDLYVPPSSGLAWARVTPAAAGWDADALERAVEYAGAHASRGVVVLHRGRILAERYWRQADAGTTRDIASAQKSVMALLVGIAARHRLLTLQTPVTSILGPGWSAASRPREARITVRHLLTMTSGLDEELRYEAPAGARWRYNNAAYHQVHPVLERVAGSSLQSFSTRVLFRRLGMRSARWTERPGDGLLGLALTPRDMARFGLFVLGGARWGTGPTFVDPGYLRAALAPSQRLNPSYGYLWWLNGKPWHLLGNDPGRRPGPIIPAAPADLVAALGAADQKIYVVPSLDLVVCRQGSRAARRQLAFDQGWWELLTAAAPRR